MSFCKAGIPISLVLIAGSAALADTIISGSVSGVWEPSGNPYVVVDSTWVPEDSSLIIQPSVVITCEQNGTPFKAYGKLFAVGTQDNLIEITAPAGPRLFITLSGTGADADTLMHVNMGGKIYLAGSGHYISHIQLTYSAGGEEACNYSPTGIKGPADDITIRYCIINIISGSGYPWYNAHACGIASVNGLIDSCVIKIRATSGISGEMFSAASACAVGSCEGIFTNNVISVYSSASYAQYVSISDATGFANTTGCVEHNLVRAHSGGSGQSPKGIYESNADVINNTIYLLHTSGGGYGIDNSGVILNNVIFNSIVAGTGLSEGSLTKYNTLYNFATYYSNLSPDTLGNRIENPMINLENGELLFDSPCINRGDPSPEYNDPDGTRNDRGWQPYNPGPRPNLVASQNSLDFGQVMPGSFAELPLTFINQGQRAAEITNWRTLDTTYTLVDTLPIGPINSGDSVHLSIRFSPAEGVPYLHHEMKFFGNSSPYYIELNGIGIGDTSGINSNAPIISNRAIVYPPHPNPFNLSTVIRFSLPQAGWVRLEVFDIQGQEIETISRQFATGQQEIPFDGSRLPSGIYLYRITATNQITTGKMVLLK